jgi:amidase
MGYAAAVDDLALLGAVELAAKVRSGEVRSAELVELALDRIERFDRALGAIMTLDAESARRAAAELDRRPADGPLHGVPITVKDAWATAGLRTTSGMVERADHMPATDAPLVARLRAAGAVVVAKTAVPQEITGQETASALAGRTRNPWDPRRTPGGSSGGAAVALAVGFGALELGSDSGGSIRQPAHCCGVFGHVATTGLLPLRGHLPTLEVDDEERPIDLFSAGPMARTAADLDVALTVLAARPLPPPDLGRLRVAAWVGDDAFPVSHEVAERMEAAIEALVADGATVDRPAFPIGAGVRQAWARWLGSPTEQTSAAHRERAGIERAWADLFADHDVVLCPISPVVATEHDPDPAKVHDVERRIARTIDVDGIERPYLDQMAWNILVGAAGLPATAVPLGLGSSGLPVGAQVVGPRGSDRTTIAVAGRLGRFQPPPGFVSGTS